LGEPESDRVRALRGSAVAFEACMAMRVDGSGSLNRIVRAQPSGRSTSLKKVHPRTSMRLRRSTGIRTAKARQRKMVGRSVR